MKYYSFWFMGVDTEVKVISEMEILNGYWDCWKEKMIKKYGEEKFQKYSEFDCIDDWVVDNWATPSNREEYEKQNFQKNRKES
jgi:hypothetical protein